MYLVLNDIIISFVKLLIIEFITIAQIHRFLLPHVKLHIMIIFVIVFHCECVSAMNSLSL